MAFVTYEVFLTIEVDEKEDAETAVLQADKILDNLGVSIDLINNVEVYGLEENKK